MNNKKIGLIILIAVILGLFSYFIWTKTINRQQQAGCTQEAKLCPDGSAVGRTGPNCEFDECPNSPSLPKGYSLDSYAITKILETACAKNSDCQTPAEYLIRSNCPYTSLCLENKCTVVCPMAAPLP